MGAAGSSIVGQAAEVSLEAFLNHIAVLITIASSQGRFSIDIHHLTVDEAAVVVQEEVQRWHDEQGNGECVDGERGEICH